VRKHGLEEAGATPFQDRVGRLAVLSLAARPGPTDVTATATIRAIELVTVLAVGAVRRRAAF
jgi:hypothetical protein